MTMNKRAQYEKYLWNAAKNPMSTAGQKWISDHALSLAEAIKARNEARLQRDQGSSAGSVTYRLTTEEYAAFIIALGTQTVNNGLIKRWEDVETLR